MPPTQPDGYLAVPSTANGRAILVLHAWWGLNDTIKTLCTRLAEAGFVAFAPDLYHGKVANTIADAETYARALFGNPEPVEADLRQAVAFLNEKAGQPEGGLAVMGFSLGASYALDLSVTAPEYIKSVVVFYGTGPGDYSNSQAAYLGHFAETDDFEPRAEVDQLEDTLKKAGRPVTFYHYAGTGHWFFEPDREDAYDEAAAKLAWKRTLAFLTGSAT